MIISIIVLITVVLVLFCNRLFCPTIIYDFSHYMKQYEIPIVAVHINDNVYFFLADTGASISLISKDVFEKEKSAFVKTGDKTLLVGIDGLEHTTDLYFVVSEIGENVFSLRVQVSDMNLDYLSEDIKISGLLGSDFFNENNLIINYDNCRIEL